MFTFSQETDSDRDEVEWLYDLAFAPGRHALSSYKLRANVPPVPELSVVARDDLGVLGGAIRYWPVSIGDADATALLLGPVAVHPTRQGEGLGAMLIFDTLERATAAGWDRIILVGDEPYYSRFGFSRQMASRLRFPPPTNPDRILAREMRPGAFDQISGEVCPIR
ncbi:MAG: N-acetyltransferase [Pseudomonadota bacterium]